MKSLRVKYTKHLAHCLVHSKCLINSNSTESIGQYIYPQRKIRNISHTLQKKKKTKIKEKENCLRYKSQLNSNSFQKSF